MGKKFFSLNEVHQALGGDGVVSLQHLYNVAKTGELHTVRLGRRILVPGWVVDQLLAGPDNK